MHFLVIASLVLVAWTAPAGARQFSDTSCTCVGTYPPSPTALSLALAPTATTAGSKVAVSGHGCAGGVTLTVFFDSAVVGTTTTDSSGAFSTSVTIPSGAGPGTHSITVSGGGCNQVQAIGIESAVVRGFAFTGPRNVYGLLEVAAGMGLLGVVLVMVSRRRRAVRRMIDD